MNTDQDRAAKHRPSQYELDTATLVELGRELDSDDPALLAAAFWKRHEVAPNPAAVTMASLILTGEVEL